MTPYDWVDYAYLLDLKDSIEYIKIRSPRRNAAEAEELATELVDGKSRPQVPGAPSLSNYKKIEETLQMGLDPSRIAKATYNAGQALDDDQLAAMGTNINALKEMLPEDQSVSLFGIDDVEPSDYAKMRFLKSVRVLIDPLLPLRLALSGELSGSEVDNMKLFYPQLYEALRETLLGLLANNTKRLSLNTQRQIATFFGVPRINPSTLALMQSKYVKAEPRGAELFADEAARQTTDMQRIGGTT